MYQGDKNCESSCADDLSQPPVLSLRTSPLAASEEVVALYQAQLLPCSVAVASSMHALGVNSDAIDAAVEEMCMRQHKADKQQDDAAVQQKEEQKLNAEERKVGMEATRASTDAAKKEVANMIKKPDAASSGGGGGSLGSQ